MLHSFSYCEIADTILNIELVNEVVVNCGEWNFKFHQKWMKLHTIYVIDKRHRACFFIKISGARWKEDIVATGATTNTHTVPVKQ